MTVGPSGHYLSLKFIYIVYKAGVLQLTACSSVMMDRREKMAKALCALFCVGMVVLLLPLGVTARLCCDPECNRKIFRVIIMSLCSDLRLLLVPVSYHTVYFSL